MEAYIGPTGLMVPFKCPTALQSQPVDRSNYRTTLGGRRKEQRGPRGRRSWSVDIGSATPDQVNQLGALVEGFYGRPPWRWVDPWSKITNLLSPSASVLGSGTWAGTGATLGGAGVTADGLRFGRSVNIAATEAILFGYRDSQSDYFPVLPLSRFAASFYGSGTGNARVDFYDGNGTYLSTLNGPSTTGTWSRRIVADMVPANAVSGQLRSSGVTTGTLPTVTWSTSALPWATGKGCNRVTIDGLSEAIQYAVETEPNLRRSAITFTVIELG